MSEEAAAKYQYLEARCRQWLETLTGTPLEGSLQETLKTGVALVTAVNTIRPGICAKASTSKMPFKQMENITNYMDACTKLGVPKSSLFQIAALYENKDMLAVLTNIQALSSAAQKEADYAGPFFGGPVEGLRTALDAPEPTIAVLEAALREVEQTAALPPSDAMVTTAKEKLQKLKQEAQAMFEREQQGLIDAAEKAEEVHLISCPWVDVAGREAAAAEKKRLNNAMLHVLCFDPNEDIVKVAKHKGWTQEEQEKRWLVVFERIKLIIKEKREADPENKSSLRVMCNGQPPPDPKNGSPPELLGNAQPGELLGGLSAGFTPEKGSLVWVVYHSTQSPHPKGNAYKEGPVDLATKAPSVGRP